MLKLKVNLWRVSLERTQQIFKKNPVSFKLLLNFLVKNYIKKKINIINLTET